MKRGAVVLTPFPFSDLTGQKTRPAVVASVTERPGRDVILVFLTTQQKGQPLPTDLVIPASHPDFARTGLKGPATMKCDKLATVDTRLVLGELGELSPGLVHEMDDRLRLALGL
jgi:mRNA interferase MazF